MAVHGREVAVAEEPTRQVNQVNALIEQFAAAGDGRVGAPFLVVAKAAAVAVAGADVEQWADVPGVHEFACLDKGWMKAVVEADLD